MYLATLEATAFQTRELLDARHAASGVNLTALKVDGGLVRNELLMPFQADILGKPVVRPIVSETTSLGSPDYGDALRRCSPGPPLPPPPRPPART